MGDKSFNIFEGLLTEEDRNGFPCKLSSTEEPEFFMSMNGYGRSV
jgi:hypothetical protein